MSVRVTARLAACRSNAVEKAEFIPLCFGPGLSAAYEKHLDSVARRVSLSSVLERLGDAASCASSLDVIANSSWKSRLEFFVFFSLLVVLPATAVTAAAVATDPPGTSDRCHSRDEKDLLTPSSAVPSCISSVRHGRAEGPHRRQGAWRGARQDEIGAPPDTLYAVTVANAGQQGQ